MFIGSRTGDVKFSKADIRRTRRDLEYEPVVSFEDGLQATVGWYVETLGGLRKVQRVA
jgi:UDP-glucose 4-epimerase